MKNSGILILIWFLFLSSCSKDDDNGSNSGKVYVINNTTFGISSNKSNARQTTDGINNAIEQAKVEGYTRVKLNPGDYLIRCTGSDGYKDWNGLFMPNNITLDLTGVKLYVESTNGQSAKLFRIDQVENVTIKGGHLIGDRGDYSSPEEKHSGSCAIDIICSRNITIDGLKMELFAGSVIYIGYGYIGPNERRLNKNIKILNCDISNSWMHGIAIVHVSGVEIAKNKICSIGGVEPGFGIDIEPETGWNDTPPWKSWVENVNIHHNEFKDIIGYKGDIVGLGIVNDYSADIEVADNTFENAAVIINRNPKRIRLMRNTLKGWESYMVARTSEDVYMPLEGPNKNNHEFPERVANCSTQTGYIKETDNYTWCD
ncbi:MAG: right-handed parallel beta-helix repeat-containing protein [Tannerella sp.]|jgi:hypothetical protein|nr:right-handed parallel beta-helix repeat-containing protein [Tannerella sp.]